MRVLVTWGSKRGGTEGIAAIVGERLKATGIEVHLMRADLVRSLDGIDAVIIGGALYSQRWHRAARRFVERHRLALRQRPVWMFSSGPLDGRADHSEIAPTRQVRALMERVGAQGHVTFGGRLSPDARGFPASAMAKTLAGDWRRPERIAAWALQVAQELPAARPLPVIDERDRIWSRLGPPLLSAVVSSALAALLLWWTTTPWLALSAAGAIAVLAFVAVALSSFNHAGSRPSQSRT
jgi:menaquinone-dependent protoporphyrinogen oxidase